MVPILRRRLRANLAEFGQCLPETAMALQAALPNSSATFCRGRWAMPTVGASDAVRRPDPIGQTLFVLREMKSTIESGEPIALCGIGDGYLAGALITFDISVTVIEPDVANVLAACCLHDFTGSDGAIRQFDWFVGEDWMEQIRRAEMTAPKMCVRQHPDAAAIESNLQNLTREPLTCA
jgi:hypothetical protein